MIKKSFYAIAIFAVLGGQGFAEDMTAAALLTKVEAAYQGLETYQSKGTIKVSMDMGGRKMDTETSFSVTLKKPNLYVITWAQKNSPLPAMAQTGAVWSDGAQPYLYMGVTKAYGKMENDQIALGGATGISGGAAYTIPSLFLDAFKGQASPFARFKDPTIEGSEKIDDEDCYVISAPSKVSKQEKLWVSKKSFLIKRHYRSLESPEGGFEVPEMTDEQLEESIKAMGKEVTEESKRSVREMMKKSMAMLKTSKLKGSTTETHTAISSPELKDGDFVYEVPKGAVLKESLFGSVLGGGQAVPKEKADAGKE